MIYKEFKGEKISMLGMGGMRFPCDSKGEVDIEATEELIDTCIKNGINYFDSAWFYHNGKSEEIFGSILKKYPRESFNFATKMPWHGYETREEMKAVFETQLNRTALGYFDYYLLHNVYEKNIDIYTSEELGIVDYLLEQKKAGKIRHLGFSTHGSLSLMEDFIKKYHSEMEFCQIQLNWLDWTLQQAKEKVELLNRYNIPVWVMEPVRGGRLAKLSDEDEAMLKGMRPDESTAAWAFRFLQGIEGVTVVLSGMSDEMQLSDNLKTFTESKPLSLKENELLENIAAKILSKKTLTCTYCKYCVEECPSQLEIPKILEYYSNMCLIADNPDRAVLEKAVENGKMPEDCIGCGKCENKCPQGIKISEMMGDFAQRLK